MARTGEQRIAGYYTLTSASLLLADLAPEIGKKRPRYRPLLTTMLKAGAELASPYSARKAHPDFV